MHKLAELCVKRPVFATVLILSLVVVGYFAYLQLGVDRFPKVDFPTITISTHLTGAAPEEIETDITDKIEEAVNTISGIDQLQSTSSEGVSQVIVQFVLEKDADVAAQEVRDKVNTILRDLPKDADPPIIQKFDPDSVPVLAIALSGPAPIRDITEFADKKLRRRLESINGVGQVLIVGGRPRQINVVVDTEKLSALGLTTAQVVGALQTQNVQIPGGKVEQGLRDMTLRTYGRVLQPQDFANVAIMSKNGYPVKIGDVARIEDSVAEPESVASVDGKSAVVLSIRKQSGTNTVEVVDRLKERVRDLQKELPKGWQMRTVRDQSQYVVAAVDAVKEHLILGSLFAALIVWFFLSSPKVIEMVMLLAATLATYTLLFGLHDFAAGVPNLHISIPIFFLLWAIGAWVGARREWHFAQRVGVAVVALIVAALVPFGAIAIMFWPGAGTEVPAVTQSNVASTDTKAGDSNSAGRDLSPAVVTSSTRAPAGAATGAPVASDSIQPTATVPTRKAVRSVPTDARASSQDDTPVTPVSTPSVAQLRVTSTPAGARVTINGIGWGQTPVTVPNLPLGAKTVRLSIAGYRSQQRTVDLRAAGASAAVHMALKAEPAPVNR